MVKISLITSTPKFRQIFSVYGAKHINVLGQKQNEYHVAWLSCTHIPFKIILKFNVFWNETGRHLKQLSLEKLGLHLKSEKHQKKKIKKGKITAGQEEKSPVIHSCCSAVLIWSNHLSPK